VAGAMLCPRDLTVDKIDMAHPQTAYCHTHKINLFQEVQSTAQYTLEKTREEDLSKERKLTPRCKESLLQEGNNQKVVDVPNNLACLRKKNTRVAEAKDRVMC